MSPLTMRQKMQSDMVPCLSELERDSNGGYRGGFETKDVPAESDQANP